MDINVHPSKLKPIFSRKQQELKADFQGTSPTPFVGRFGYPNISVGIMALPEKRNDAWMFDSPRHWASQNMAIDNVIDYRSSLINSRFLANVKVSNVNNSHASSKLLEIGQEIGMASKPVDVEINLEQKPVFRLNTFDRMAPTGPNAKLRKAEITENPKIARKVDKVVSDTDLRAGEALNYLYENGYDENFLTKLFSIGNLGVQKARKLVPTRWSITAIDDTLGKNMIEEIKDYEVDSYNAFFGGYLGNYYIIMTFPRQWSYELFETYAGSFEKGKDMKQGETESQGNNMSGKRVWTDYESVYGRKDYADDTAGGYYAARIGILESLKKRKKQASILALRFITDEYYLPLGVWVVREAVRKAMSNTPIEFEEEEYMLKYARALIKKKFGYDADILLAKSKLMKEMKTQSSLRGWVM